MWRSVPIPVTPRLRAKEAEESSGKKTKFYAQKTPKSLPAVPFPVKMPHPVCLCMFVPSDPEGLIIFGACAVVAVAVVVIEEWPTIKETYSQVRARRRRRMVVAPHQRFDASADDQPLNASGIHESVHEAQEMTMRSRNLVACPLLWLLITGGKSGITST